ncbi:TadE/TadG family type IV pilus assembly protein [Gorillibacterium sp. sgz5001074]|uniref:TadE/TadG family type IV pilus assembly protein n=1 Tax=Gorillibacterium sp. sgz5001074 TaxID=3446695 RepID=UPI003F676AF1
MIKKKPRIRFMRGSHGSMTVEAAIILPGVMGLVLFMVGLIQWASAEIALRSALDETGKSVASYWMPMRIVYGEAKEKIGGTRAGAWTQSAWSRLEEVRSRWTESEDWLQQYEALLPEPVGRILEWETHARASWEDAALETADRAIHRITDPLLCAAFDPILKHYANGMFLKKENLHVEEVRLPSLVPGGDPYVELIASYEWRLPVPLLNRTFLMKKKTYERAWVGADG